MSKKMPPVHGALTEKTVYSLTLDTARFKVKNYAFCLHSLFKCFVWIPEHRLFLHTTLTDRFYTRGGMRLLRGTSCSCKYRVILSLEAPDYCLMRNTGKCKSLDESTISRGWGVHAVSHRCRYVYINFEVIISITIFIDNSLGPLAR